jgi:hypothetical protein
VPAQLRSTHNGVKSPTPLQGAAKPRCLLNPTTRQLARALAVVQVILYNSLGLNTRLMVWFKWHCDLHRLVDKALAGAVMSGQLWVMSHTVPSGTTDRGMGQCTSRATWCS